ncbi:trimethylamine methyltransferase family protein [Paracoccaceae bacterium]|nr:trimethylamine methyltransferase family protein [Paracoccaceae bacterium]
MQEGPKQVLLAGQNALHDLKLGGSASYTGTGGAAPTVLDDETKTYHPSTLADLFSAARLADTLDHIHFFSRSVVARDIEDPLEFDLGTAVASVFGTSKHVVVSASEAAHVPKIAELCYEIAGGEAAFRERPFLSLNINHAVPPLRMHAQSIAVMHAAVDAGIPVHCNVFGQLGASSAVTLAGSVAQTLAEVLAGLAFVHALDPQAPRIAGPRPMIIDLRSGGMAGGAGEQSMATAMAAQALRAWQIPCSVIAGATDSKLVDFQSGYEKAMTIQSAMQSGANLITQAAGAQAALMGVSFAAMVADNDMLGAILRANILPEISEETLSLAAITEVVAGEGHFLGRPETYARMRSDFLYPDVADRGLIEEWQASDKLDMGSRAAQQARMVLQNHWPKHTSQALRDRYLKRFGLPLGPA